MSEDITPLVAASEGQLSLGPLTFRTSSTGSLKRRASPSFEDQEQSNRKRPREETTHMLSNAAKMAPEPIANLDLAEELAQELQCGCCSALVYRPVVVSPCQHFFCGSCCLLWIKNGGTNCPACRGISTGVAPSRPLQAIVDVLVRAHPSRARSERERIQADAVYRLNTPMRIPAPREASPEPNLNISRDYACPCPHCSPGNPFGWRCPQPIPDPNTDQEHAWHIDDGLPPGHAHCGNCESLLAVAAPLTSKCDFCQVSFCGIAVQGRCCALPISQQEPHNMMDVSDLIQSPDVYECFDSNAHEVEIMLDYLNVRGINPALIFRDIVAYYASSPQGFQPLFELDVFVDLWNVEAGIQGDPSTPRRFCCRMCALEILLFGLRAWWVRERKKGLLEESVTVRKDCPDGPICMNQKDIAHAKEFNHIFSQDEERHTPDVQITTTAVVTEAFTASAIPSLHETRLSNDIAFEPPHSSTPPL